MPTQRIDDRQIDLSDLVDGDVTNTSGAVGVLRHNRAASAAPTGGDNFAAGWAVGSAWYYSGIWYVCSGNGSWVQTYPATVSTLSSDNVTNESTVDSGAGSVSAALSSLATDLAAIVDADLLYEAITGTCNASNVTFTLPHSISEGEFVTQNGLVLNPTLDYTVSGTTLTMVLAPKTGDVLKLRSMTGSGATAPLVGLGFDVALDFGTLPRPSAKFTFAASGATTGSRVFMQADPEVLGDDLEMDGFACAAWVSSANNITAYVQAVPGPVMGTYNFQVFVSVA